METVTATPHRARRIVAILAGILAGAGLASGAIYVKIPNLGGDVATEGHNDGTWFEAFSGTYGVERDLVESSTKGTAGLDIGVGRLLPIGMAFRLNDAAAPLAQAAVNGEVLGEVEIHLVDLVEPTPLVFGIIRLQNARVKDFTMDSPGAGRPWFQAFFIYDSIEIINRLPQPGGIEEQIVEWTLVPDGGTSGGDGGWTLPGAALQAWLDGFFTPEQQLDPEIGGLYADVDRDGLPAVLEYKLGRDPLDPSDGTGVVSHWMVHSSGGQYLEVSFVQRPDDSTPDTRLVVQVADGRMQWGAGDGLAVLMSRTPLGADREELVYRLAYSRAEKPRQFVRLAVSYAGPGH